MGKIAELSAKLEALLVKINTKIASKLDATATAANSDKLQGKSLSEVRALSSSDALSQVELDQSDIRGQYGDVAFFGESNVPMALVGGPLLKPINLVSSDANLDTAKLAVVPFSEVFNKWRRISHFINGVFPANASELTGWAYDAQTDKISSTINSATIIGLISNDRFSEYTLETIMKSTAADNDGVGVCLAFTKIGDREYSVMAMVDSGGLSDGGTIPNTGSPKLVIAVNYGQGVNWGHQLLASIPISVPAQNWPGPDFSQGIRILAKRLDTGVFEVSCTKADGTEWSTPIFWTGPVPELFADPCAIGFISYSQPGASWEMAQMPVNKRDIIDTRTMTVWRWDGAAWMNSGSALDHGVMMPGRFYKNVFGTPYQTFYLDHDGTLFSVGETSTISL